MKKKTFGEINPGNKFRWQRKLYVKDSKYCAVEIFTGKLLTDYELKTSELVTPVKVQIRVLS